MATRVKTDPTGVVSVSMDKPSRKAERELENVSIRRSKNGGYILEQRFKTRTGNKSRGFDVGYSEPETLTFATKADLHKHLDKVC